MTHNPYRLTWLPALPLPAQRTGLALALLEALTTDIRSGRLKPGERLPPCRPLAWTLGLNPGTVHKAYREAMRRGLLTGEVGRGSFVRSTGGVSSFPVEWPNGDPRSRTIDFCDNFPCPLREVGGIRQQIEALAGDPALPSLLGYQHDSAHPAHRDMAARWIQRCGVAARPATTFLTSGALHAGFISLMTVCRPGDTIVTEALTSQAVRGAALRLGVKVRGIGIDARGILPDALEEVLKKEKITAAYFVPTLHNPTASLLPLARRRQVAGLLSRFGIPLIEDDIFAPLLDEPLPPITSFMPDDGFYIAGLSKALAPGFRLAFLSAPDRYREDILTNLRLTTWLASPLLAEVACRLLTSGAGEKMIRAQKAEIAHRQALARDVLGKEGVLLPGHPSAPHLWVILPEPWRASVLRDALAARDVSVLAADSFAVSRRLNPVHALRLCLGPPPTRAHVRDGLTLVRDVLRRPDTAFM